MDRLTKREGDIVYMVKDGNLLSPVALSGQEVRQVLQRLAEYEDGRHGKWIKYTISDLFSHTCSACHCDVKEKTPHCPHCGAKMDGDV